MTKQQTPQEGKLGHMQIPVTILGEREWHGERQYLCQLKVRVYRADDEPMWQWAKNVVIDAEEVR